MRTGKTGEIRKNITLLKKIENILKTYARRNPSIGYY